ncbi:ubiquitin-protein ligase peroxin 12 [Tulasnella sp. JGI-2019a]|nr:ubiquitin-protein ligase peroxin 12 [Tulasnella sp. JGI-2019a]KAG8996830.1 ubiquitin-protein ligase peroxin 12 [Tulasnella sp. JGI-2019a]
MKFGKEIQSNQIPGWSQFYLDYKGLKKIISALENSSNAFADASSSPLRPGSILGGPTSNESQLQALPLAAQASVGVASAGYEDDRGPVFQAHKAAFFWKLERELEKINAFYLQTEADLKKRLATLLEKRKAAAQRLQAIIEEPTIDGGVEWRAVQEGFRLLDKDLNKLQQFIEINATGFRKILKKWDKRSKSHMKELYLARQVEIQPCFNRQLLADLSDTLAACLLDSSDPSSVDLTSSAAPLSIPPMDLYLSSQLLMQQSSTSSTFRELEMSMTKAISQNDEIATREVLSLAERLSEEPEAGTSITRILWKAAIEAKSPLADIIMSSSAYDIHYVDDINGRTCIHGAAIAGELRLVQKCVQSGLEIDRVDFYGRSALHYASMNGHAELSRRLLALGADPRIRDKDNYNALIYAIINGHVECVRVVLDDSRVGVEPEDVQTDVIPLSLACQFGHIQVVSLLLQHGARKLPNTNGEYPLHVAAREGHAELCRMLLSVDNGFRKDTPDKYSEWTPLFHSARRGHTETVRTLLEAGCNPTVVDETGCPPVFYAAWYGFLPCVELLLRAIRHPSSSSTTDPAAPKDTFQKATSISPTSAMMLGRAAEEGDVIPSLSLPPPIMPFRIYGHNYLDNTYLLQVMLGRSGPGSRQQAVQLLPNIVGQTHKPFNPVGLRNPSLKLVINPKSDSSSAPHTVSLPLSDGENNTFAFQLQKLDDMTLEFSFFPTFGNKAIGRAIALPGTLNCDIGDPATVTYDSDGSKPVDLPILDHRLHLIGKVAIDVCIISPFSGVKVEVGGTLETYWKSTAIGPTPAPTIPARTILGNIVAPSRSFSLNPSSTHHPPSIRSSTPVPGSNNSGGVTFSSLSGEYIHVVVQVTRDMVAVIYPSFSLPTEGYNLGIADITLGQFQSLAKSLKADSSHLGNARTSAEWHTILSKSMLTLGQVLQILPPSMGICLELAFPNMHARSRYGLGRGHRLNPFVDAVLGTVFAVSSSAAPARAGRRKIVFSSFEPNVCTALNWKQPNYPVFFASDCGLPASRHLEAATGFSNSLMDFRCTSVDSAVSFAKSNNLLGVLLNASLLGRVPSLIHAIKDTGVLLAAFGAEEHLALLPPLVLGDPITPTSVDAVLRGGVLSYMDHTAAAARTAVY